eukprot:1847726-Amphidinium_carterae.2
MLRTSRGRVASSSRSGLKISRRQIRTALCVRISYIVSQCLSFWGVGCDSRVQSFRVLSRLENSSLHHVCARLFDNRTLYNLSSVRLRLADST